VVFRPIAVRAFKASALGDGRDWSRARKRWRDLRKKSFDLPITRFEGSFARIRQPSQACWMQRHQNLN